MTSARGLHAVVTGCGAIGSFVLPLLARMPRIGRVTLVDPDTYQRANLDTQNIFPSDVGEPKVACQARRLRAANSQLDVTALHAAIGDVPMGLLRADLMVGCLDSRLARQSMNETAWRLGVPLVDAGVLASQGLARVSVVLPGNEGACLLCAWNDGDFAALEIEYPCGVPAADVPRSDVSPCLAAMAAALQAMECDKLIRGLTAGNAPSRHLMVDANTQRMFSTVVRRNPDCRFDHAIWAPEPFHCSLRRTALADVLATTGRLSVAGHRFATKLVCPQCGFRVEGLRIDRPRLECPACHARMVPPDFESLLPQLDGSLPAELLCHNLAQIGILPADVIDGAAKQFEILQEAM